MEVVKPDRFSSLIKLCQPTSSQESNWENCPFDTIVDTERDSELDLSSPSPTVSDATGIFITSLPESGSVDQSRAQDNDDDMDFRTPTEQHTRNSSEDEPAAVTSDTLRTVDLSDDTGVNQFSRNRFLEEDLANEEKNVVSSEDVENIWDGETMPIETEPVVNEVEEDKKVNDTEVLISEREEIREELTSVNLGENSSEKMCRDLALGKNGKTRESEGCSETLLLRLAGEKEELVRESKNFDLGESEEIVKACDYDSEPDLIVKSTVCEMGHKDTGKDTGKDENLDNSMNMEGFDSGGAKRTKEERICGVDGHFGRRRKLPLSIMQRKEQNTGSRVVGENVEVKKEFFNDLLEILRPVSPNVESDSKDVDFLEIAERRGLTFPQPRWYSQ